MTAVSENGHALRYASEKLKLTGGQEIVEAAVANASPYARVLKVGLLSGRWCIELFDINLHTLEDVLRECATLLDLDPDHAAQGGALLLGTVVVKDLARDLEAGRLNELTLVLS